MKESTKLLPWCVFLTLLMVFYYGFVIYYPMDTVWFLGVSLTTGVLIYMWNGWFQLRKSERHVKVVK